MNNREKQYPRAMVRKIFLIEEFNLNIFISIGSQSTQLILPHHWPERLVNWRGALEHLPLSRVTSSIWFTYLQYLLTYSNLVGEIHKNEAQSRNLIDNSDFCSHYHSWFLLRFSLMLTLFLMFFMPFLQIFSATIKP